MLIDRISGENNGRPRTVPQDGDRLGSDQERHRLHGQSVLSLRNHFSRFFHSIARHIAPINSYTALKISQQLKTVGGHSKELHYFGGFVTFRIVKTWAFN